MNVNVDTVIANLCPAMRDAIAVVLQSFNLPVNQVLLSQPLNGCSVVTPLPAPDRVARVAYKYYFALFEAEWNAVSSALRSVEAVQFGQVMCDSTIYYQTFTSPAQNTLPPLSATTNPEWLAPSSGVCSLNAAA